MTPAAGSVVVCVQPAVETKPPRVSMLTTVRSPSSATTSSRKSTSVNAAVPRMTRAAPALTASRTASIERRPPPVCTGTPSSPAIRSR